MFYNFELLRCYVCTIQFLVVFYYEIEQQLKFPTRMKKVYVMLVDARDITASKVHPYFMNASFLKVFLEKNVVPFAAETNEDVCESMDGDVQKKIIPWRLMTPDSHAEQEYSYRKKGRKPDGLVLVTSLINKVPNLGGENLNGRLEFTFVFAT